MSTEEDLREIQFLAAMLEHVDVVQTRSLLLEDFEARTLTFQPRDEDAIRAFVTASRLLPAASASALVDYYVRHLTADRAQEPVDILLVCPKQPELDALQVVLGLKPGTLADTTDGSGRHLFRGSLHSAVARRDLSYTLICLNKQTNMLSAAEVADILATHPTQLAVLVGMSAGRVGKVGLGDVVTAEQVLYVAPGTRLDDDMIVEPETFRPPRRVSEDLAAARLRSQGWIKSYRENIDRADSFDLELPPAEELARDPQHKHAVILAVEEKHETTTLGPWMTRHSGDAKALEMEAGGFATACRNRDVDWAIFRGICDFGRQVDDDGQILEERPKNWQTAATIAAGTAFRLWITEGSRYFS